MKIKAFIKNYKFKWVDVVGVVFILIGIVGILNVMPKNTTESSKLYYLCIGVDKTVPMDQRVEFNNSIGQADGIFLIAIDEKRKTMDIISIPRDTIVTIEKYYSDMEYIGPEEAQICLQYAYADGLERSCELMVDRVEEIFDGIEIDGYVSINLSALYQINDVVGGVSLVVNDKLVAEALAVEVGTEVHLNSENMPIYIRTREKREAEGAYQRTLRYKEYVTAFIPQAKETVKRNPEIVLSMFDILQEHMVTDIEISDIVSLLTNITDMSMENIQYDTLEGNIILGADGYEEFYPDEWKLNALKKRIS